MKGAVTFTRQAEDSVLIQLIKELTFVVTEINPTIMLESEKSI